MKGFTDIHHHILYGLDDGAQSFKEMCAMLRRASEDGIQRIVATPHVTPGVRPFDRQQFDQAISRARSWCEEQGIELALFGGSEILYTDQTVRLLDRNEVPTMNGTDLVLVEFSPDVRYERLQSALAQLRRGGYRPILAHAERYQCLTRRVERLHRLRDELDVRYQVNSNTIIRQRDLFIRRFVHRIVEWDLLDFVATDAHHATGPRVANMSAAHGILAETYDMDYANALMNGGALFETE